MKKTTLIILCLICSGAAAQQEMPYFRPLELPDAAKRALNKHLGKWEYLMSVVTARDSAGKHIGWQYADIIKGDFDGNNRMDYAVLVRALDLPPSQRSNLVVLLSRQQTYEVHVIKRNDFGQSMVLYLQKKGTPIIDFETEKSITLDTDAIVFAMIETSATTYFYLNGRFQDLLTGD